MRLFHFPSSRKLTALTVLLVGIAVPASFQPGGVLANAAAAEAETPLDFNRVRQLMQRVQAGETLSAEDRAYLERGRREAQARNAARKAGNTTAPATTTRVADPKLVAALVPLDELNGTYKGEDGGLYGGGRNAPTGDHLTAYLRESHAIQPLDENGRPAKAGKVVLLSIGMSNTTQEFSQFVKTANAYAGKSANLVIVDGAIGARTATAWSLDGVEHLPAGEEERLLKIITATGRSVKKGFGDTWSTVESRLKTNGVTSQQVQVLWIKQAEAMPARLGEYPEYARTLAANLVAILNIAKHRYPNLRVAYLSSRIFGGYATTALNPEPYAYEGAFAVRRVIQDQIAGEPRLNCDPARGEVKAPVVVWGPYLWANGTTPRKSDGLVWNEDDFVTNDRTHPATAARQKVAELLLAFFRQDSGARLWFNAGARSATANPRGRRSGMEKSERTGDPGSIAA